MHTTKQKITVGYSLLLAMLLFSLVFVHQEMENLSTADDMQNLKTDSLLLLINEKDQNTLRMLRVLSEANDSLLSASEIKDILSGQDTLIRKKRIQNRVITTRDSLITKAKKKGFFKRLSEVFSPSNKDTTLLVNTSLEFATDTILEPIHGNDSLQEQIRKASRDKRSQRKKVIRRNSVTYQRLNDQLTSRMDSLIKDYEEEMMLRTRQDAALQQSARMRSAQIIGGIAVGAVLLSVFFLILILRDITKSNRYRKQLEDANKKAENLLTAREKMMLAITHDFKAPLGSIMGYTELLARLTADERQQFYLENMKGSSEHLLKLVNDLLDFHRLDLNKAEVNRISFTPSQLFEEINGCFQPLTTAKGLSLHYHIDPELSGKYVSDPLRIHQIINNLLSNAMKFTEQGTITLTVSYSTSRLIVKVSDTGKGMAPQDKERIFHEFTRLPGAQGEEGFGLGLSIVQKLIYLLAGSIEVESTLGAGSCFTVVLPLYPVNDITDTETKAAQTVVSSSAEKKRFAPLGTSSEKKKLRTLLIDDDKIQLDLTAAMLKQQGIVSVCCNQLEELIEQLRSSSFDVLLTDIQMPAINGFDLVRLLRASNIPQAQTIPIIAVTARNEMSQQTLHEHGFEGCLHKPFTVKELLTTVSCGRTMINDESTKSIDKPIKTNNKPSSSNVEQTATYHFSALTAFSEGDIAAGAAIVCSFVEETEKNADCLQQGLDAQNMDGIAAMAHKLLPLFTLINVSEALSFLSWLESQRGKPFSDEAQRLTAQLVTIVRQVAKAAQEYLLSLK